MKDNEPKKTHVQQEQTDMFIIIIIIKVLQSINDRFDNQLLNNHEWQWKFLIQCREQRSLFYEVCLHNNVWLDLM